MSFLGFGKKESYLGIDLGTTSIKVIELKKEKGVPTLVTYGYAERAMGEVVRGSPEEVQQRTVSLLRRLCKEVGVSSHKAVTALPNFSVFSSVISLPMMPPKELAAAISWEAKKIVPLPLEEVILDWKILGETSKTPAEIEIKKKANYQVLLTAASKSLVQKYVEIFRLAGLELLSLETEAFALVRSLIGGDDSVIMILDTSAVTTDIIIIKKRIPIFNRSIDVGGVTVTRAIANSLGIDFERAEQFKRDIGMRGSSKIPQVIEQAFRPIVDEIRYSIEHFQNQYRENVEKIVLSGGSVYLPNLPEYFSNALNLKVIIGDPWAKISYPAEIRPALEEIAPRFAVAIGLALRELE